MDQYEKFVWRETRPGIWQRDVDEPEKYYSTVAKQYEGSGRMYFAMTGHISLTVATTSDESRVEAEKRLENAFQQGWTHLRYEQPTIASRVEYDRVANKFIKTYQACHDYAEQADWLDTTVKFICTRQTIDEWCNSDPPAPKLPTLFVITSQSSAADDGDCILRRELVLRSPHDIMDGIGTLHLLNRLVTHVSSAYFTALPVDTLVCDGSESANLSPPFRIAAAIPPTPSPAQQARLQEIAAVETARIQEGIEFEIGIPYRQGAVLPGKHQRIEHTFSVEDTKQLLAACKVNNVTITHAFHAGIAIALRDVQERTATPRRARYSTYLLRNERKHCATPYNTAMHAATVYHSASSGRLAVDMTIWSSGDEYADEVDQRNEYMRILHTIGDFYRKSRDDPDHPKVAPYIWAYATPALPEEILRTQQSPPVPPPSPLPSVSISSMGKIDTIIAPRNGVFEVYNPWVTGEELRNGFALFLGTFRDRLCLSGAYNDAWHSEDDAVSFLNRCKNVVYQGLSIGS